jgi:PAS domain-containing protein
MKQKEVELILTRQLAEYLAMPIFLVDPVGTLIFYNEPAERLLGKRFEETGEMPAGEWTTIFTPLDDTGAPLSPEELPLMIVLNRGRPAHRSFWIRGLDQVLRRIEVTAFPLVGLANQSMGGVAIFWESPENQ